MLTGPKNVDWIHWLNEWIFSIVSIPSSTILLHFFFCHAAAKLLQSCPTLCDPIDGSPPGSLVPGILQARTLEWVAISFSNARKWKVRVKLLICVRLFETSWSAAYQAPLSVGFSRQENWSRLSLPSLKILLREYYSKKHYLRVIKLYKFLTSKPDTMQWHSGQFYFLNFCKKKKKFVSKIQPLSAPVNDSS